MGVAVAIKQIAWFIFPFYLVLILRRHGLKNAITTIGTCGAIFLVFNGFFIISNTLLWQESVLAPMTGNLFPSGVGVITLVMTGVLSVESSTPFFAAELVVGALALIWYYRNCLKLPNAGLVAAVLPLFFAWRSMWSYFFYIDIIIFTTMLIYDYKDQIHETY
jgi:uncharacterized membrane protein